jgi:hypothetical protein
LTETGLRPRRARSRASFPKRSGIKPDRCQITPPSHRSAELSYCEAVEPLRRPLLRGTAASGFPPPHGRVNGSRPSHQPGPVAPFD